MKKLLVILMVLATTSVFAGKITANCVVVGAYEGTRITYLDSVMEYRYVYEKGNFKSYIKKKGKWAPNTTGTIKYDGDSIINKIKLFGNVEISYVDFKTGEYVKTLRFREGDKKGAYVYTGTCTITREKSK
jgi:hypothetical protein